MSRPTAPGMALGALAFIMSQAVACADPAPGPALGAAQVTVATSGADLDPDGYSVRVDSGPAQAVAINGSISLSALAAGDHVIVLDGVAANCAVSDENPRLVRISSDATARVEFAIICAQITGALYVTVATTGTDFDLDGYAVSLDGGLSQPMAINETTTLSALAAGDHAVALSGVAGNCAVTGDSLRTVRVSAGATARVDFAIACVTLGVASVSVEPGMLAIDPGDTVRLVATPRDGRGAPLSGRAIAWVSANATVATVLSSGLVRAVAPGGTTVTATVDGVSGSATVSVRGTPVDLQGTWTFVEKLSFTPQCSMEGVCWSGDECSDTGSFTFTQTGFAFVGTANQSGSCGVGQRVVADGTINGREITFAAGFCRYQGALSEPLDRLGATSDCDGTMAAWVLGYRQSSQ